jgi:hypothetical protein
MAERYPSTSSGTRMQRDLCNRYFELQDGGDWREVENAYRDFMHNNAAEKGVGILTNWHMVENVNESHYMYVAETLSKLLSAHEASAAHHSIWNREARAFRKLTEFLDFYSFDSEEEAAGRVHSRYEYERNRKWSLIWDKALPLITGGFK